MASPVNDTAISWGLARFYKTNIHFFDLRLVFNFLNYIKSFQMCPGKLTSFLAHSSIIGRVSEAVSIVRPRMFGDPLIVSNAVPSS